MDEISKSIRGLILLIEQGTLALAVWNVYLEKVPDDSLKELALRVRSSLEYGMRTKQLKGVVKANYIGALNSWKSEKKESSIQKAGDELIAASERYLQEHKISIA